MAETFWTLPQALAWIMTRSAAAVDQLGTAKPKARTTAGFTFWDVLEAVTSQGEASSESAARDILKEGGPRNYAYSQAKSEIVAAIVKGAILAYRVSGNKREKINEVDAADLIVSHDEHDHPVMQRVARGLLVGEMMEPIFNAASVRAAFPSADISEDREPDPKATRQISRKALRDWFETAIVGPCRQKGLTISEDQLIDEARRSGRFSASPTIEMIRDLLVKTTDIRPGRGKRATWPG